MTPEDLEESDREILKELRKGRCTPASLTDWTSISKQTVHNRLNILVAAGHVEKVHSSGLYQLIDDPEKGDREQ